MIDLAQFLLDRLAEDEKIAERSVHRNQFGDIVSWHGYHLDAPNIPRGTVAVPGPRMLDDLRAKRQIVVNHAQRLQAAGEQHDGHTLRLLALPYAHHADYRKEWAP